MRSARPITAERVDRLMRWSALWLLRLAGWLVQTAGLAAPIERAVEQRLTPIIAIFARGICMLIVAKAALSFAKRTRDRGGAPEDERENQVRAVIGSRLRKLARNKDLRARIATLLMILQNADQETARATRRLSHGLTRRFGGFFLSSFETSASAATALTAHFNNTS